MKIIKEQISTHLRDVLEKSMWDMELGLNKVSNITAEGRTARQIFERAGKRLYKALQRIEVKTATK